MSLQCFSSNYLRVIKIKWDKMSNKNIGMKLLPNSEKVISENLFSFPKIYSIQIIIKKSFSENEKVFRKKVIGK